MIGVLAAQAHKEGDRMHKEASKGSGGSTLRHALRDELLDGFSTARDLSSRLGVPEKDIAHHLEHLERSLRGTRGRLEMEPASCLGCGFVFRKRERLTRPSSCPICNGERIEPPRFHVAESASGNRPDRPSSPRLKKTRSRPLRDAMLDDDRHDSWYYEQKFAS